MYKLQLDDSILLFFFFWYRKKRLEWNIQADLLLRLIGTPGWIPKFEQRSKGEIFKNPRKRDISKLMALPKCLGSLHPTRKVYYFLVKCCLNGEW